MKCGRRERAEWSHKWKWACLLSLMGLVFTQGKELLLTVRPLDHHLEDSSVSNSSTSLKALHLSRHAGCLRDIDNIWRGKLGVNLESVRFQGPLLMTGENSRHIWEQYSDYFNKFDVIVTSDTAPISRIFLTRLNELHGRLIVYLSNRFDTGMRKDEQENEAYTRELHKATFSTSKIKVVSYSDYDLRYLARKEAVADEREVATIYPLGDYPTNGLDITWESSGYGPKGDPWAEREVQDPSRDYSDTYFFSPYQNEQDSALRKRAKEQGIKYFLGYANDTALFKAQVVLPLAVCNYASFESVQRGVVAIVPSKRLIVSAKEKKDPDWPYDIFGPKDIVASENPQYVCWHMYPQCRILFDSWEELFSLLLSLTTDEIDKKRQACAQIAQSRRNEIVDQWKRVLKLNV